MQLILSKNTQFITFHFNFMFLTQNHIEHLTTDEKFSHRLLSSRSELNFKSILENPDELTQFILDPTSFNLQNRVHISDPIVQKLFKLSRDLCFSIHNTRMKSLQTLIKQGNDKWSFHDRMCNNSMHCNDLIDRDVIIWNK